jgi:hypothetical protein
MRARLLPAIFLLTISVARAAPQAHFDFASLRELIEARQARSVEDVLAALPEDLRSGYTLVFASRSLQDATLDSPRAILFGAAAELMLTFNGEPRQRGFSAIETVEFDARTNSFIFREITFAPGTSDPVRISDANPPRCSVCHGNPARPIWDTAPSWPGVYGEQYGAGLSAAELKGMRRFLARQPTHPRYRYLLGANALARRETYVSSSGVLYNGSAAEPPNARLAAFLATQNVRAIIQSLALRPAFPSHIYVLLGAADGTCGPVADFYPPAMQAMISSDIKRFRAIADDAQRQQRESKLQRGADRGPAHPQSTEATDKAAFRYIAERYLEVPTERWTLAFERGSHDLSTPNGSITFEQALYAWLVQTDDRLQTLSSYRTYLPDDAYCEYLRLKSRSALQDWHAANPQRSAAVDVATHNESDAARSSSQLQTLLQSCIGCHSDDVAPRLPFSDPTQLAALLPTGGYPHGRLIDEILFRLTPAAAAQRMPRGVYVDTAQQRALEEYFLHLSQTRGQ